MFRKTKTDPVLTKAVSAEQVHYSAVFGDSAAFNDSLNKDGAWQVMNARQVSRIWEVSPTVNRAVSILAGQIATTPYHIKKRVGTKITNEVDHDLIVSLLYGNNKKTRTGIIKATVAWLLLSNRAIWAIEEVPQTIRNKNSRIPKYRIAVLNPQYCKIKPDPSDRGWEVEYNVNESKSRIYKWNEVIIFDDFSPREDGENYYYPISNLNSLEYDIQMERYGKRMLFNYFDKSMQIDAVLTSEGSLQDEELRKLRAQIEEQYSAKNRGRFGRTLIISGTGMKYEQPKPVEVPSSVVQMMEQTAANHAMVLGVPVPLLYGVHGGQSKDLLQYEAMMWKQTLLPLCAIIQDGITKYLEFTKPNSTNEEKNTHYEFEFLTRKVPALRAEHLDAARTEIAFTTQGMITVNEWREANGYDALQGEYAEFGNMPMPMYQNKVSAEQAAAKATASMSLPNDPNGRDQSNSGEAQLVDTSGQK